TTRPTTPRAPAYKASLGLAPSTSSVRKTGGNSPRKAPQQPRIKARCSFAVKLSSDDSHQTQAAVPPTPTTSQTCRKLRRWNQGVGNVAEARVSVTGTLSQPAVVRG